MPPRSGPKSLQDLEDARLDPRETRVALLRGHARARPGERLRQLDGGEVVEGTDMTVEELGRQTRRNMLSALLEAERGPDVGDSMGVDNEPQTFH